jgi:hypothetical protein
VTITAKWLERLGASQRQIAAFRKLWGDGPAPMTVEAAVDNAEAFDWGWFARYLLTDAAWDEYMRAEASAWAEFERAEAAARAEYDRSTVSAFIFERAEASARAELDRTTAPAWADLKRTCARAFAEAYINQEDAS